MKDVRRSSAIIVFKADALRFGIFGGLFAHPFFLYQIIDGRGGFRRFLFFGFCGLRFLFGLFFGGRFVRPLLFLLFVQEVSLGGEFDGVHDDKTEDEEEKGSDAAPRLRRAQQIGG